MPPERRRTACDAEGHDLKLATELERLGAELRAIRDLMDERDRRYDEREAAHKLALDTAERALDAYKAQANEWRGTLNDVSLRMMLRTEYESAHSSIVEKIESLRLAQSEMTGKDEALAQGRATGRWIIGLVAGMGVSLLVAVIDGVMLAIHLLAGK